MAKIVRGGQSGSADHINSSQATFRAQISAITDAVRQMGGNAEIGSGALVNDPLSAPYVLYVNPYTGKDTFVGGSYSTSGSATERIELQRLECGYSEARPFKTINRAVIEAGIITAKSFYTQPLSNNDLVTIVLAPGACTLLNGTGAASVSEWASGKNPTNAELQEFNPQATGGILLPRGVSVCSLDLRKTIFRPDVVPAVANEATDCSNRREIFKVTGTGYYYGFTFMDKAGSTASHHLLSCFGFASQAELDEFYAKIRQAFGGTNNTGGLDLALAVTRTPEYQIVGPAPAAGSQTIDTDTTDSASPYIFNCSIRSKYGLCGIFADGSKPSGFKSMVTAQFTGVSKQRDLTCWQKYSGGNWVSMETDTYATYISTNPDDVRMNPLRRSFHVRAINGAFIQEVSVFAIGQGVHHWVQSGGEIISNGGFSNFGGVAGLAEGYRTSSFPTDIDWTINRLKVANNLTAVSNNVKRIYLGTVSSVTSSTITLETALGDSLTVPGVPDLVARDGYTLRQNSYVWVENPLGDDWRSPFTGSAWSVGAPAQLNITTALTDPSSAAVPVTSGVSEAIGKRVYIRRLVDTRTPAQRRYTLKLNNTNQLARTPVRDYVLQVTTGVAPIVSEISTSDVLVVNNTANIRPNGVAYAAEITLRRGNASVTWTAGASYLQGETVKRNNKHYTCIEANSDATFDAFKWQESYVHMSSEFNPEDFYKNEAPVLTFDNDTDGADTSTTLGYNLNTLWTTDVLVQTQYRAATDYRALHLLLTALGFSSAQAHTILIPKPETSRELNPAVSGDMGGYTPNGAANAIGNWPIQFRRPSFMQLLTHNWAWAGFLNYTKSLPQYQRQLSAQNKFTYYFTNANGGRVYPTGFNEEGYQVTPRGIEDLATGQTLTVENLGSNDLTLPEPQTSFDSLSATNLSAGAITVAGTAALNGNTALNGNVTLNNTARAALAATTAQAGLVELATTAEAAAGQSQVVALTPGGLTQWANSKQVAFRSTADQRIYIGTWDGVAPVNYDANYRVNYWPAPAAVANSNTPDGVTFKPFATLYDAAAWANEFLGTEQNAVLIMKPGFYQINGVEFKCRININGAHTGTTGSLVGGQIGDYDINNPGNSIMLYATPYIQSYYSPGSTTPYFVTGGGMTIHGGDITKVHFISTDMTLGAAQIPDSNFMYGSAVRTATVKASTGNRVKEWVSAFIAYLRLSSPSYPAIPSGFVPDASSMIGIRNGSASITQCTLGARGVYGSLNPGGVPGVGYITVDNSSLVIGGNRIRGNEFWDFTGVISGGPKYSGWCPSMIYCLGTVNLYSTGYYTGDVPTPGFDYNLDLNNIQFERTHYGSDSRNGGTNPATAIANAPGSADPSDPWAAGEDSTSRLARGPQMACILYAPLGATINFPPYSFWPRWGTAGTAQRSGFKGKLGSIAQIVFGGITSPYFALVGRATVKYLYQYDSTPIQEAGVADGANWTAAAAAVDWGAENVAANNVAIQTSLNLAAIRNKQGIFYKMGTTVSCLGSELVF